MRLCRAEANSTSKGVETVRLPGVGTNAEGHVKEPGYGDGGNDGLTIRRVGEYRAYRVWLDFSVDDGAWADEEGYVWHLLKEPCVTIVLRENTMHKPMQEDTFATQTSDYIFAQHRTISFMSPVQYLKYA
jgi:hypothetical protein